MKVVKKPVKIIINTLSLQSKNEELWSTITHGVGFVASMFGLLFLLRKFSESSTIVIIAICVYGASLITLYLVSTIYHSTTKPRLRFMFRVLDHISIYFLIAGTYTPVVLLGLQHSLGWELLYAVWSVALIGLILKLFFTGKYEAFSLILYVVMGCLIFIDFSALKDVVPEVGINFLIAGGAFYIGGIVFYVWNKLKYNHVIWHLFVMAGSASHFLMIYCYL